MHLPRLQRAGLALLPLVTVAPAAIEGPAYAPADGTTLVRTFTLSLDVSVDDSETLINGSGDMAPEIESDTSFVRTLAVTDRIASSADGRPTALERTYDTVSMEIESPMKMSMMGQVTEANLAFEGTSALDARGVKFTWDAESDAFKRAWSDDEGDAEMLEGLTEDLDMRGMLPSGDVAVGDSWEVDPATFVDIVFAGGDLSFEMTSTGDAAPPGMGSAEDQTDGRESWQELEDSTVTATLGEPESSGDSRIAVIAFEVDLSANADNEEDMLEAIEAQAPGAGVDIETATTKSYLEGKGVLKWDMAAGHAISLTFSGDVSAEIEQIASISMGGQEMAIESTTETSGTINLEVSVSAE